LSQLIKAADMAVYNAKRGGRFRARSRDHYAEWINNLALDRARGNSLVFNGDFSSGTLHSGAIGDATGWSAVNVAYTPGLT
jgi:hypothetical protein